MRRIDVFGVIALFLLFTTATMAQWGQMATTQFQTGTWSDARGYFFEVRYSGHPAPLVQASLHDRMLVISVGQASGAPGVSFQNQMSQRYPLPMDADPSRMVRQELQGRIVIMIPRRQVGYPSRW